MSQPIVKRAAECDATTQEWGQLTWYASGSLGNGGGMTVGRCLIKPGRENPKHLHPNCSEVLVVQAGTIRHTSGEKGEEVELGPGDVITIPPGFYHQARNVGATDAVLFIAFSSPDRQVQGE